MTHMVQLQEQEVYAESGDRVQREFLLFVLRILGLEVFGGLRGFGCLGFGDLRGSFFVVRWGGSLHWFTAPT